MNEINIFLASSDELAEERRTFSVAIDHINRVAKPKGYQFILQKWEYLDASMSAKFKQEEYNEAIRNCDYCIVLFWKKAGMYTEEELNLSLERGNKGEKPFATYILFKEAEEDEITPELRQLRARGNLGERYYSFKDGSKELILRIIIIAHRILAASFNLNLADCFTIKDNVLKSSYTKILNLMEDVPSELRDEFINLRTI